MIALLLVTAPFVTLTDDLRRRHVRTLRTAMRHADLSLDRAAREAERDTSQFHRQLEGLEGSLPSLWKQPVPFWQWFAVMLAEEFGLPPSVRRASHLRRISLVRKRMARMSEPIGNKERVS